MGHSNSNLKVKACVSVQGEGCPVDGITLSYRRRRSCCGGRRRRLVAAFTFPHHGWRQVLGEDVRRNTSSEAAVLPIEHLKKKDGGTAVRVSCLSGGAPVYRTEVTLADLLQRLGLTTRGKEAKVFFSLSVGKMEGSEPNVHAVTALFCNGRRCGGGGAATPADTPHRRSAQTEQEAHDDQRKWNIFEAATASDWECDDTGKDEVAVVQDREGVEQAWNSFEATTTPDWSCEEYGEDEKALAQDRDETEHEEEETQNEGNLCRVNETSPRQSGPQQGWREVLAHIAAVVAVILVWFNAWQEYSRGPWE